MTTNALRHVSAESMADGLAENRTGRASTADILAAHHQDLKDENGRLLVLDKWTQQNADGTTEPAEEWLDVTDWTRRQIYAWLGY
jgi:hypothetical protein